MFIGIDVGSTTVKAVAVDPTSRSLLWKRYERHESRQAEKVLELLLDIGAAFPDVSNNAVRTFITGSGAGPLREPLGSKFVQEVNAVMLAAEHLHPDVGSVIELGGQDAKIVIYKEVKGTGSKRAVASMNDKCASGTGATIDKCLIKAGMTETEAARLSWDSTKLHHVAAKCGVFAETDIVNLVKSGVPSEEILCSLVDAVVMQNLSVLTRGNTLRAKVLLLGGPNVYLPLLRQCWRQRIPELWQARGYRYPGEMSVSDLIVVPEDAQYYAAYGAAIYGLLQPAGTGHYRGTEPLEAFIRDGRKAALGASAGPALVNSARERDSFTAKHRIPPFEPLELERGQSVRGIIGIDGGSTSSKAVVVGEDGSILCKQYRLSEGNPLADAKSLLADVRSWASGQEAFLDIAGLGVTGYAGDILEQTLAADVHVVETVAHMAAATQAFGEVDVICDVGGQDIKVLFMAHGEMRDFRLSNQCSAGNGMMLQATASQLGVPIERYAESAFRAELSPNFSYGCAVFLDSDRVNFQREGYSGDELLAGLARVLPKNIWQYVVQIPRMAKLGTHFVLQGGTQANLAAVKAQIDYISERVPGAVVRVHPHPGEAGAIGAALEALRVVSQRGESRFVGLDAAIGLEYRSRNDEETRCRFCPNLCSRTFVDASTPKGRTSRFISGFSCEKGTVESEQALKGVVEERRRLKSRFPNLAQFEAKLAFRSFFPSEPLPDADTWLEDVELRRGVFGGTKRKTVRRKIERSSKEQGERRRQLRVGIPRVLNLYSSAPLFRTYFETLGLESENIVFSDVTSEELWSEGGKYGSVDPCFPAKVSQAHVHNLLFHKHPARPLNYLFFPALTHVPTFVSGVQDSTCCPVVAGTPNVTKAAFTKEADFFAEAGIDYLDPALTLTERNYFALQMFEAWGDRLGITADENAFACAQGFEALASFDEEMQRRGLEILEALERDNGVGVLLLARPYHLDPGLNHSVLEEFQALGYPILTIRSIPKDPDWLRRFFRSDLERKLIDSPLEVSDVWPENYSTNSVQKVWAAKFAARHPNLVVLDLSSFKCGHDAPTYGLIDNIIGYSRTPYSALHDIDANRPSGSIKIRVGTYAHALTKHSQHLSELAARRSELERRVEEKRRQLLEERAAKLRAAALANPKIRAIRESTAGVFQDCLEENTAFADWMVDGRSPDNYEIRLPVISAELAERTHSISFPV